MSFELGQDYRVDNTLGIYLYACCHQRNTIHTAACSHFKYVSTLPIYGKNFNSLTKTQQKYYILPPSALFYVGNREQLSACKAHNFRCIIFNRKTSIKVSRAILHKNPTCRVKMSAWYFHFDARL